MSARRSSICFCWPLKPRSSLLIRPLTSLFISSDGLPGKSLTSPGAISQRIEVDTVHPHYPADGIFISAYIELELSSEPARTFIHYRIFRENGIPVGSRYDDIFVFPVAQIDHSFCYHEMHTISGESSFNSLDIFPAASLSSVHRSRLNERTL